MNSWLRRLRAALGMGLTWAVAWAPIGLLIGLVFGGNSVTPDGFPADDWLMPFAMFGFIGGAVFSGVLRLAEGRRRFDELSLPRFGAWGALGGAVLGGILVAWWGVDSGFGAVMWPRAAVLFGATTLMSAASAAGSLAIARRGHDREALASGEAVGELGPAQENTPHS